jgi:two-component system OmpR family sensor kinase
MMAHLRGVGGPARRPIAAGVAPPHDPAADESTLLRVLCHELRAPVSSLGSLTRVLSDPTVSVPPPQRAEMAELAHRQAVHLDALLAEARRAVTSVYDLPVRSTTVPLQDALSAARAVVPRERMRVSVSSRAAGRPVRTPIVQQVLTNLIDNAARHSPRRSPVLVTARTARRRLILSVGNETDRADRVRAGLAAPAVPAGMSGLGLPIVAGLVSTVDGMVSIRRHRGLMFVDVVLPLGKRSAPTRG